MRSGWQVRREVPVGDPTIRGWVDVLAFRPTDRALLVCEFKTEILDVGAVERAVGLYELESGPAARSIGWRPVSVRCALIVLETGATTSAIRANRSALAQSFPTRSPELLSWLQGSSPAGPDRGWCLAMIDPLSRRSAWLREPAWDRRHTAPRYLDYGDFVRAMERRPG